MPDATKVYSERQESMIARYLGWTLVPASGARDFDKGDIKSDNFLAECKTHIAPQVRISFSLSVWKKLTAEAMANFKTPVLFTDDGTQLIERTWAIVDIRSLPCAHDVYVISEPKMRINKSTVSFVPDNISTPHKHFLMMCKHSEQNIGFAIMPLATFKHMFFVGVM